MEKFIGEQVIIFDTLWAMFCNSSDAEATEFVVEVAADKERVSLIITDDGKGVSSLVSERIIKEPGITTRGQGSGLSLFVTRLSLAKIGATLTYEGKADLPSADKPGAKFKITFLKEMPTTK